ncbi:MAG TPA: phosphoribosylanthranilate isomerase [Chryseolinea sp.]|nr:phosphoribosylanthranilate isomerase [Chryseolinea sp.]
MRDLDNIGTVAALSPDYLGFIEYTRSPRFVGAGFRTPELADSIRRVGVFVNESIDVIEGRITSARYDAVQLHGEEGPDFCARLRDKGVPVIKVFRVDDEFDFDETKAYFNKVDQLLFDARGKQPGGNGIRFDPHTLQRYDQRIPFFLSGGLQPETLLEDIANLSGMNLYGVDLNSGVERAPAIKDPDRVRASIQHVRSVK